MHLVAELESAARRNETNLGARLAAVRQELTRFDAALREFVAQT
jgi:hypothetical protein